MEKKKDRKFTKINKNELFILFNLAVRNVYFRFFNQFFRQCDGVTMGHSLAPVLAELFMNKLEDEKIFLLTKNKVKNGLDMWTISWLLLKEVKKIYRNY
jgi:hypothetical protein